MMLLIRCMLMIIVISIVYALIPNTIRKYSSCRKSSILSFSIPSFSIPFTKSTSLSSSSSSSPSSSSSSSSKEDDDYDAELKKEAMEMLECLTSPR